MPETVEVHVIGAGLAGCEAAYQLAKRNITVQLHEMKPEKYSPAHSYPGFAELVCSNSLRADGLANAVGLLKEEMRRLDSLVMRAADIARVPAGGALAVNRQQFSDYITDAVRSDARISVLSGEVTDISMLGGIKIIATGPLTSEALAKNISDLTGGDELHFFDAAAPIVSSESIDMDKAFFASRYGKGDGSDYLNCPMTYGEYTDFYNALIEAECAPVKGFENENVFEGCMPVEVMAKRGFDTLRYGPMKPVGIRDAEGNQPYAVVQLRKEDAAGQMFNLVGFQTHLKFGEQRRVFGMIPALAKAEFLRYGVMHKNTYINSPRLLDAHYRLRNDNSIFFAGQITGVEGYVESASSGLLAGINAAEMLLGRPLTYFSAKTAIGALGAYVSNSASLNFQPMNVNYGIMEAPGIKIKKKEEKNRYIAERALKEIEEQKMIMAGDA